MPDLPPPPAASFASDNFAGVAPEVLAALAAANEGPAQAYGDDPWTARAEAALHDLFGTPIESLMCWGGTGANVVGLATVLQPWQAVLTTDTAHIVVDECGAPARFTGSTITPIPHVDGKLEPAALDPYLHWLGVEHHPQPAVVSITQSTEMGTLYTLDELAALCEKAHAHGLLVHLDGARIANAVAALGQGLPAMVRDTGVDLMTFGFTKDGGMYGETVVFLRPEMAERARYVRKQAGQLPSKARYIAAQVLALLEDDLWLRHARHANAMATRLAAATRDIPGVALLGEPQVNAVFAALPPAAIRPLQGWSFFWDWDLEASLVRWMTSFTTTEDDVDRFAAGVRAIVADHA
ncbi:MAG TPA: aminotransferase class I/II-fold pyridoxal phosphate-dependent enzyme [Acidimicrobiales bacterium]|nr:aminotransferase class I/II-fold pyridoxal phosphate-dependent enzyme [Acidimicrobiales bacterium]